MITNSWKCAICWLSRFILSRTFAFKAEVFFLSTRRWLDEVLNEISAIHRASIFQKKRSISAFLGKRSKLRDYFRDYYVQWLANKDGNQLHYHNAKCLKKNIFSKNLTFSIWFARITRGPLTAYSIFLMQGFMLSNTRLCWVLILRAEVRNPVLRPDILQYSSLKSLIWGIGDLNPLMAGSGKHGLDLRFCNLYI